MLLFLIRKFFLVVVTLIILSVIGYHILGRDPNNAFSELGYVPGYFAYVEQLLAGDFGVSRDSHVPIAQQILAVFPATLLLCLSASLFSLLLGIPLGFLAAVYRESLFARLLVSAASLSLAVPVFWLAIVLQAYLGIVPSDDLAFLTSPKLLFDTFSLERLLELLQTLALPTFILTIPATLEMIRITHQRSVYVLSQNYVKVARARGWSPFKVWRTHIIGNTLPPLIPMIARNITLIFAFGMLIENIVSWSGIGRWMIHALSLKDYPAISAGVLAIGIFVLAVDLLANLITQLLDPNKKKDWYSEN